MDDHIVTEGKAQIFQPPSVFYNPVQEFNRDLTIAVLSEFSKSYFDRQKKMSLHKKQPTESSVSNKSAETDINATCVSITEPSVTKEPGIVHEDGMNIFEGLSASGLRYGYTIIIM